VQCSETLENSVHTSLLQNSLQTKLQQPNVIAKRNTKITHSRVGPPFLGVFRGGNRVQVIQNNPQQAHFCNGFCKRLVVLKNSVRLPPSAWQLRHCPPTLIRVTLFFFSQFILIISNLEIPEQCAAQGYYLWGWMFISCDTRLHLPIRVIHTE
jgi:hypothetical protein